MRTMTFDEAQRAYDNAAPVEVSDTEAGLQWTIEEASALIGRAERAMVDGDMQAAIDLLRSAGAELSNADWA